MKAITHNPRQQHVQCDSKVFFFCVLSILRVFLGKVDFSSLPFFIEMDEEEKKRKKWEKEVIDLIFFVCSSLSLFLSFIHLFLFTFFRIFRRLCAPVTVWLWEQKPFWLQKLLCCLRSHWLIQHRDSWIICWAKKLATSIIVKDWRNWFA